jgi:hypothetical protein
MAELLVGFSRSMWELVTRSTHNDASGKELRLRWFSEALSQRQNGNGAGAGCMRHICVVVGENVVEVAEVTHTVSAGRTHMCARNIIESHYTIKIQITENACSQT